MSKDIEDARYLYKLFGKTIDKALNISSAAGKNLSF
jgi:hypothetical protein